MDSCGGIGPVIHGVKAVTPLLEVHFRSGNLGF